MKITRITSKGEEVVYEKELTLEQEKKISMFFEKQMKAKREHCEDLQRCFKEGEFDEYIK